MDAQDITLDSFWQELFYSHELCRLSGEKPDESAIQAYERSAKAIGGEPMGLNALGLRLRDARMWQRPPIELRKFLISRCPEVVVTLGADVGGASDATVALAE